MSKLSHTLTRLSLGAFAAAATVAAIPGAAHAGAFYLQEQSVKGLGRAYSGEVTDKGADELWWNPAAIAGTTHRELYVGVHGLLLSTTVTDAGSNATRPVPPAGLTTPVGGDPHAYDPIENGGAPNLAFSMPVNDRFAVALSVHAPFNFTTNYTQNSWARYDVLKTHLLTADVQGTVAMKATDWLDIGVGADAQYTKALLSNAYPNLDPRLPDGSTVLKGDGWNYGWNVGAQAHFGTVTLGASYRSAMDHDLDGSIVLGGLLGPLAGANMNTNAEASFTTPWFATLGLRWQATPQLTLNAQVQRFGWSEFDAIRVKIAGATTPIAQNYKDTTAGGVGAEFAISPVWTIRTGVQYDQTPTQDDLRTARVPDSDRWLYAVGTSWQMRPGVTLDASAGYIAFQGGVIYHDNVFYQGTAAQTVVRERGYGVGNGKVLSLALRWMF